MTIQTNGNATEMIESAEDHSESTIQLSTSVADHEKTLPSLERLRDQGSYQQFSGETGINRERDRRCLIRASNDYEAIQCWLAEYRHTPTTYRGYQREAERLLLWCIYQQRKAFSSLDREDFECYIQFLSNPQPTSIWCGRQGGVGKNKGSEHWRPFVGPLSDASKTTAITIIHSLISYLVDANYLAYDPLKLIRKKIKATHAFHHRQLTVQERILAPDEWHAILDALENMPESTPHERDEKHRLRFIIHSLYFLGLRVSELVNHTWGSFRKENDHWWFYVLGKGNKLRKIPVNNQLMTTVYGYRQQLKLSADPKSDEDFPLVMSWRTGNPLSARSINLLLKKVASVAAKQFSGQVEKQEKLKRFSAHWLRHLSASMQSRAGLAFTHIKDNLRHEKGDTTRLYIHSEDEERHRAMNQLTLRGTANKG